MDPRELRYAENHAWVFEKDGIATVGITDYAASRLGDIAFLELSKVGSKVKKFQKLGEIESVKAVATVYAPLSGEIIEVNESLIEEPELVRKDPFGESWLVKLRPDDVSELNNLMNWEEYQRAISEEEDQG